MTPWSVRPMAGWSKAAARSASLPMLHAPSSSEYSEWTCRCATVGELIGMKTIGVAADATRASAALQLPRGRILRASKLFGRTRRGRATPVATVAAAQEWVRLDHDAP